MELARGEGLRATPETRTADVLAVLRREDVAASPADRGGTADSRQTGKTAHFAPPGREETVKRISDRGYFGYHYISLEPSGRRMIVPAALRADDGVRIVAGAWPKAQYVICDGQGRIVDRIPLVGSRAAQATAAMERLARYAAAER